MNIQHKKICLFLLRVLFMILLLISIGVLFLLFTKHNFVDLIQDQVYAHEVLTPYNVDVWGNYTETKGVQVLDKLRYYNYIGEKEGKYQVQETPYAHNLEHRTVTNVQTHSNDNFITYT